MRSKHKHMPWLFVLFFLTTLASAQKNAEFATGLEYTPKPLADTFQTNIPTSESKTLPKAVDLSKYLPTPGNQGRQGSCVGWATAYGYKTFHEKKERDWDVSKNQHIFSPAYIYNQINGGKDQGSSISTALELVKNQGVATFATAPYNPNDHLTQPSAAAKNEASKYRAAAWERVDTQNIEGLKRVMADGNAVVIGMNIHQSFYNYKGGVYKSISGSLLGGHAMLIVGYDDSKKALKILNSWGTYWGEKGFAWVDYDLFKEHCKYGYVMYDVVDTKPDSTPKPPVNVVASAGTYAGKVKISWNAVDGAEQYRVFRSYYTTGGSFEEIGVVSDTEFYDTSLTKYNWYYAYAVKSYTQNGLSYLSSAAKGYALQPKTPVVEEKKTEKRVHDVIVYGSAGCGLCKNFISQLNAKGIAHQFYDVNADKVRNQEMWNLVRTAAPGTTRVTFPIVDVKGKVMISAKFDAFLKEYSGKTTPDVVEPVKPKLEKPGQPQDMKGWEKDKLVYLSWSKVAGADGYSVFKFNAQSKEFDEMGKTDQILFTDKNVKDGENHWYAVKAYNSAGESQPSLSVNVELPKKKELPLPEQPKYVMVSGGEFADKVVLTWKATEHAEFYEVYRWDNNALGFKSIVKSGDTTYEDKNVEQDELYIYYLIAGNKTGYSKKSWLISGFASRYADSAKADKKKNLSALPTYSEKAVDLVYTKNKNIFKAVVPFKNKKGVKVLDAFYYNDGYIQQNGVFKAHAFYDKDGKILKIERFFVDAYAKSKGYFKKVTFYNRSMDSKLKEETYYVPGASKKYNLRIAFYNKQQKPFKSEVYLVEKEAKQKGFAKISTLHDDSLRVVRAEFFDENGNKINEIGE